MANPGIGGKFVSVNLNKSYGQPSHAPSSSSYGSTRARPGGHSSGGMVVLSRPRSSQKSGPKLSVPPPLNLPSLRKEHERFDLSGPGGGQGGAGSSGSGPRPSSSGMGWTKPGTVALHEKDGVDNRLSNGKAGGEALGNDSARRVFHSTADGLTRGSGAYVPPSVRTGTKDLPASSAPAQMLQPEKTVVLRGEDFPVLQASLPTASGPTQKQKDGLQQKQRTGHGEDLPKEQRDTPHFSSVGNIRPDKQSTHPFGNQTSGDGGSHRVMDQTRKQEDYFPGPLPLVQFNPRSDWADDERDTSHGLTDRGRDYANPQGESQWDRDFDIPGGSVLPHRSGHNMFNRWGQRDDGTGKNFSVEVPKMDSYSSDRRIPSREGREENSWRSPYFLKERSNAQEVTNDRNGISTRASISTWEINKDNKFISSHVGDSAQDNLARDNLGGGMAANFESASGRKDVGYSQGGRQHLNQLIEPHESWGAEKNARYGSAQHNRYRSDAFENSMGSRSLLPLGAKGPYVNDPIPNFSKDKRPFMKGEKPYTEDSYLKEFSGADFDSRHLFTGGLVGIVKKKKDVTRQADFHDPSRESFEAELEREQKMQEQERQRVIEEHERALELARIEEEERTRIAMEEEERRRRLEEEAREAAWRAEQEHLEAMRRAEEQRIAREDEKQRILLEEERRKQGAKQKLLELEARIAKRQAEEAKCDGLLHVASDSNSGMAKDRGSSRVADVGDWEDGERIVERVTTSASSESSCLSRPFEVDSRPKMSRNGSSIYSERGKPNNLWRRDMFENGSNSIFSSHDQENGLPSPRRDFGFGGRAVTKKEFNENEFISSRNYLRGGLPDPHMDDFNNLKGQRWNLSVDGDHYSRSTENDPEFLENYVEKPDGEWGQDCSRSSSYPSFQERQYQNSEADNLCSFGRSRYSMRQLSVLPPPSLTSMPKMPLRGEHQHAAHSESIDNETQYDFAARHGSPMQTDYGSGYREQDEHPEAIDHQHNNQAENSLEGNATAGSDSQTSLSVSSPPNSPPLLSHDNLDESWDSPVLSGAAEGKDGSVERSKSTSLTAEDGIDNRLEASSSISAGDDEEWTIQNGQQLQEQEEYDEDEDGYQEEDEVHEGEEINIDLTQEFEDMHLEKRGSSPVMDNLVLGFNEGVEVKLPSDESEKSSRKEESAFVQVSTNTRVQGPFDGIQGDGTIVRLVNSSHESVENAARSFQETENSAQNLMMEPTDVLNSLATYDVLDSGEVSRSTGMPKQFPVPCSAHMPLHSSGQAASPAVSVALSQAELPVKLQFGLFSGPSLIPSPVPAIQIGSIQMPLHLHPQVGPSISHIHPSQPPLFQFGQLRYTSPISQGILPLAPPSVSYVQQPNVPSQFTVNQTPGGPHLTQPGQDTAKPYPTKGNVYTLSKDNQRDLICGHLDPSEEKVTKDRDVLQANCSGEDNVSILQGQLGNSLLGKSSKKSELGPKVEDQGYCNRVVSVSLPNYKESESQLGAEGSSFMPIASERDFNGSKAHGLSSGGKAKRFFNARNSGARPLIPEDSREDSSGFQRRHRRSIPRTEFRVRENPSRRQSSFLAVRSGSKRGSIMTKLPKQSAESEYISLVSNSVRDNESGSRVVKGNEKELLKNQNISYAVEGNLKRNFHEEDIDASLQSGIVRVFEQPGIEVPSDEDDFIQVRSKRQMLNDRREQREKEIKAKSRIQKMPRKTRSTSQNIMVSTSSSKVSSSLGGEVENNFVADFVGKETRSLAEMEVAGGLNTTVVSQPLAPIGTPPVNYDGQADTRSQTTTSIQATSLDGDGLGPSVTYETNNKVLDNVQEPLGSWNNGRTTQQVMPLTQSQLEEAMKPAQFETHAVSIGEHSVSISEPSMSSSILAKEKTFSSVASPINSLLAGEKIQFGAVTSPTILAPSSHAVSHGIGPPGSNRSDIQMPPSLSAANNHCTLLDESCSQLEDCEAEAEAAASAVAVAAISSDEIGGNGGMNVCSVADSKRFGDTDADRGVTAGIAGDQQSSSQSRAEESLTVALPADLSVETPPISLWPPLPSPQNSSSQMLSHFPGGPTSPFPFYDMNPMLGGPVFAFGPREESAGTQSEPPKSSTSGSGSLGTWQHHSGVDSFYGPPAGFTGPFISPPGGIPGVQGPPHMVVYNHFAPVGQFGQVGLSFMGTTYIPSGKQPDWKHKPTTTAMGGGQEDLNSINMVPPQRNSPNVPAPIQHLAPGSPLLPMASPLAMFDVSPFQTTPDLSVPARWSHVSASPLHSVPLSMPLQQQQQQQSDAVLQPDGVLRRQFSHVPPADQSLAASRFSESRTSTPSDGGRTFSVAADASVSQFPDVLGLVDPSGSASVGALPQSAVTKSSSGTSVDCGKTAPRTSSGGNINFQTRSSTFKTQSFQQKHVPAQQYGHSAAYDYQRGGGVFQKNSGSDWSHRRMGFHGRNPNMGAEKNIPVSKVKQIYVAKQTSSGTSSVA